MLEIRLLLPDDNREDFVSGDEALDRYFRLYAGQNQFRHRIGVNYVAIMDGRVIGYAFMPGGRGSGFVGAEY
jgi:hypothetical protein